MFHFNLKTIVESNFLFLFARSLRFSTHHNLLVVRGLDCTSPDMVQLLRQRGLHCDSRGLWGLHIVRSSSQVLGALEWLILVGLKEPLSSKIIKKVGYQLAMKSCCRFVEM